MARSWAYSHTFSVRFWLTETLIKKYVKINEIKATKTISASNTIWPVEIRPRKSLMSQRRKFYPWKKDLTPFIINNFRSRPILGLRLMFSDFFGTSFLNLVFIKRSLKRSWYDGSYFLKSSNILPNCSEDMRNVGQYWMAWLDENTKPDIFCARPTILTR